MTSILKVSEIQDPTNSNTALSIDAAGKVTAPNLVMPAGSVLQVKNTILTAPTSQSIAVTTYTNITDLNVSITPTYANSLILLQARWSGEFSVTGTSWGSLFTFQRNGVPFNLPPANGSNILGHHPPAISYNLNDNDSTLESCFLDMADTPSTTSAITYSLAFLSSYSLTLYTNRPVGLNTSSGYERGTSSITVMEIAQ